MEKFCGRLTVLLSVDSTSTFKLWVTDGTVVGWGGAAGGMNAKVPSAAPALTLKRKLREGYVVLGTILPEEILGNYRDTAQEKCQALRDLINRSRSGSILRDLRPISRIGFAGVCAVLASRQESQHNVIRMTEAARLYAQKVFELAPGLPAPERTPLLEDVCMRLTSTGMPDLAALASHKRMQMAVTRPAATKARAPKAKPKAPARRPAAL